jgi:hypothetical protein
MGFNVQTFPYKFEGIFGHLEALTQRWTRCSGCNFLHRTIFDYAQSIGDTFGAISGGEFEYFPCQPKYLCKFRVSKGNVTST